MDKWDEAAVKAWEAVLAKVRLLSESGETLEGIAKLLGIKNRGSISLWLSGDRKAANASFSNMLRYLDRLGIDYVNFLPPSSRTIDKITPPAETPCEKCAELGSKIVDLEMKVERLSGEIRGMERVMDRITPARPPAAQTTTPLRASGKERAS